MNLTQVTLLRGAKTVTLGVLTDGEGFTLERSTLNPGSRVLDRSELPLVNGQTVTPGRLSGRVVELSGTIVADTRQDAHALYEDLVACVGDAGATPVTVRYTPRSTTVELDGYLDGAVTVEPAGGPWLTYTLTLVCPDPVAKSQTTQTATVGTFASPATVTNAGDATVWPVVTVTIDGTVTSLRVGNQDTGDYVELDALPAGDELVIETAPGRESVLLDGVPVMDALTSASRFFGLRAGTNEVYRTKLAGSGSITASVDWRDGWVS